MSNDDQTKALQSALDSAIDILEDVVLQSCLTNDGHVDSMCISSYAEAIRFLAAHGRLRVTWDAGRRVIASRD